MFGCEIVSFVDGLFGVRRRDAASSGASEAVGMPNIVRRVAIDVTNSNVNPVTYCITLFIVGLIITATVVVFDASGKNFEESRRNGRTHTDFARNSVSFAETFRRMLFHFR